MWVKALHIAMPVFFAIAAGVISMFAIYGREWLFGHSRNWPFFYRLFQPIRNAVVLVALLCFICLFTGITLLNAYWPNPEVSFFYVVWRWVSIVFLFTATAFVLGKVIEDHVIHASDGSLTEHCAAVMLGFPASFFMVFLFSQTEGVQHSLIEGCRILFWIAWSLLWIILLICVMLRKQTGKAL